MIAKKIESFSRVLEKLPRFGGIVMAYQKNLEEIESNPFYAIQLNRYKRALDGRNFDEVIVSDGKFPNKV
ncbi:MAG: hypothetical protein ACXQTS_06625 [Candidatus Methanospirareceae archaeon]